MSGRSYTASAQPRLRSRWYTNAQQTRMVDKPSRTWRDGASGLRVTQGPARAPLSLAEQRKRACYGY